MYIESPPGNLSGQALYDYLFRLSEALNVAMAQTERTEQKRIEEAASVTPAQQAMGEELKALIINTATVVRKEMDVMETQLNGKYTAISGQFGTFTENIGSTITATAEGVLQQFNYDEKIEALGNKTAGLEEYKQHTESYIRQGFIDRREDGTPITGIAIGENLQSTTVIIDGKTYEEFNREQSCAFYTAEKVSFRIGGNEVAYISNRKLYILDAEVTGSLTVGGWLMSHGSAGFTMRYVGG